MPEHQAYLQAQADLPESAAIAAQHIKNMDAVRKTNERQANLKAFAADVNALMKRKNLTFSEAWVEQKNANKANPQNLKWTPDDD